MLNVDDQHVNHFRKIHKYQSLTVIYLPIILSNLGPYTVSLNIRINELL